MLLDAMHKKIRNWPRIERNFDVRYISINRLNLSCNKSVPYYNLDVILMFFNVIECSWTVRIKKLSLNRNYQKICRLFWEKIKAKACHIMSYNNSMTLDCFNVIWTLLDVSWCYWVFHIKKVWVLKNFVQNLVFCFEKKNKQNFAKLDL